VAYDENLAQRIRLILGGMPGLVEKKMFGGVGFILHGNLACGVHKEARSFGLVRRNTSKPWQTPMPGSSTSPAGRWQAG